MPTRAEPHHVHQRSRTALLLIDLLQRFSGEAGGEIHRQLQPILPTLVRLRRAARAADIPIVYVNDDHSGPWRSSREEIIARAERSARGDVARKLRPARADYLVLKPGRSGFHQSPLEALLEAIGARHVILAGVATDVCVLSTAADAILRKLKVSAPRDASCTVDAERHEAALRLMETTMAVDTSPVDRLAVLAR